VAAHLDERYQLACRVELGLRQRSERLQLVTLVPHVLKHRRIETRGEHKLEHRVPVHAGCGRGRRAVAAAHLLPERSVGGQLVVGQPQPHSLGLHRRSKWVGGWRSRWHSCRRAEGVGSIHGGAGNIRRCRRPKRVCSGGIRGRRRPKRVGSRQGWLVAGGRAKRVRWRAREGVGGRRLWRWRSKRVGGVHRRRRRRRRKWVHRWRCTKRIALMNRCATFHQIRKTGAKHSTESVQRVSALDMGQSVSAAGSLAQTGARSLAQPLAHAAGPARGARGGAS
jgi:hypothetical protein